MVGVGCAAKMGKVGRVAGGTKTSGNQEGNGQVQWGTRRYRQGVGQGEGKVRAQGGNK